MLQKLWHKKWMNLETFADYAGKLTDCEKNDIFPLLFDRCNKFNIFVNRDKCNLSSEKHFILKYSK
jgi:hypothetical protein